MNEYEQLEPVSRPTVIMKSMKHYKESEIRWLEDGRIAMGKLTLIAGDPGLGKSFMTLELCARVSRGECGSADLNCLPQAVILNGEDDAGDTMRPRLNAMCANMNRVHIIEGVQMPARRHCDLAQLDRDMGPLTNAILALGGVTLIVIDPISAYMGKADSHNNAEVRSVLADLARLASLTGAAVVCVTHLNKDSGNKRAVYRAMGSLAFTAAARTVHLVTKHPGKGELDSCKRVVSMVKNNIGVDKPARVYVINNGILTYLDEEMSISADDLDGNERPMLEDESQIDRAVTLLNDELRSGERLASEMIELGKAQGIGTRAIDAAKRSLTVISEKKGKAWYWSLPPRPGEFEHHEADNPSADQYNEDMNSYGHQGYL